VNPLKDQFSSIKILDRVFDIFECFLDDASELSITQLTAKTGLPPSTIHRLCTAMEARGYLARKSGSKKIILGPSMKKLAELFPPVDRAYYISFAMKYMHQLRDKFNESIALYERSDDKRICVARLESTHALRQVMEVGQILPLSKGASGKVLLAYLSPEQVIHLVPDATPEFFATLSSVRENGYAISLGERDEGLMAIAIPIFTSGGRLLGSISVSGPVERMKNNHMTEQIGYICGIGAKLSNELQSK